MNKLYYLIVLGMCFLNQTARADALPSAQSAMQTMDFATGAKATAMGGAFSAVADDPSAIIWNPSGLAWASAPVLQTTCNKWLMGSYYQNLSAAIPLGFGTLGANLSYVNFGQFDLRNESGTLNGTTSPYSFGGGVAFAKRFGPVGVGVAGKYYRENIDDNVYYAVGVDAGLMFEKGGLRLAAGGRNFGSFTGYNLPTDYYGGASYRLSLGLFSMLFASDYTLSPDQNGIYRGGLEVGYQKMVFLRGGYQTSNYDLGYTNSAGLCFGVGLAVKAFKVDYSFTTHADLGATHKLSLSVALGSSKTN